MLKILERNENFCIIKRSFWASFNIKIIFFFWIHSSKAWTRKNYISFHGQWIGCVCVSWVEILCVYFQVLSVLAGCIRYECIFSGPYAAGLFCIKSGETRANMNIHPWHIFQYILSLFPINFNANDNRGEIAIFSG